MRARIDTLLGSADAAEPVHVTARVTPSPSREWRAELRTETRGTPGTRTLVAPSCPALADAVAVIVAWMIDPAVRAFTAPPTPETTAPDAPAPPPARPPPDASPTAPETAAPPPAAPVAEPVRSAPPSRSSSSRGWRVRVSVGARGDLGPLPSFAVGPAARVSIVRGRVRLFLHGAWRPTQRFERTASPSTGGAFDLWNVGFGACLRWPSRTVTPTLCASLEGGALSGAGFGVTRPDTDTQPWLAASAGGGFEVPLTSWLSLSARVSALVPWVRPRFVLVNVGEVHQPSPVGLASEIDAEVIF